MKLRHQMENEDRSDKWLGGTENNDQQCGSKTGHLEEIRRYLTAVISCKERAQTIQNRC